MRQLPGVGFRFCPSSLCRASSSELAARLRKSSWVDSFDCATAIRFEIQALHKFASFPERPLATALSI